MGLFNLPLQTHDPNFPVIQYADDTLIILEASGRQLLCLKGLLETFGQATGLRVNYAKSCLVPINTSREKAEHLAGVLGCQVGSFPFTYLGLPLGIVKPNLQHFMPLIDRIDRRLAICSSALSFGEDCRWSIQFFRLFLLIQWEFFPSLRVRRRQSRRD